MHHPSKQQFSKKSGLLRISGIWLDFNFLHWTKFHWAAFRKACVLDRSVGDFGQSVLMTPERPLSVALKEHLRVLLHWCASIAGLPCSPPSHRNIRSAGTLLLCTLMESPGTRLKVILGKGSDTKLRNLRLIQKPGAESRMVQLYATA